MDADRLDRQLRVGGWDQRALDQATVGVVGDSDLLASLYVVSAAALGLNNLVVIAPKLDERLLETAHGLNPELRITLLEGFYTHPLMDDIFTGCSVIVDLSHYALANKLLLDKGHRENLPVIRGFCFDGTGEQGYKVFTYVKGRQWQELEQVVSPRNLPGDHFSDAVLGIIVAGIALEETKNILMGGRPSPEVITYKREKLAPVQTDKNICVVGAGALGNFVGLGLAYSGFARVTFLDPDVVEVANLNRQILFFDAVGLSKAEILSKRLNSIFGIETESRARSFKEDTDILHYDAIFDCVDTFETRILLSERCNSQEKVLVSGGSNVDSGQVVVYDPEKVQPTPAELLGLYAIVTRRNMETYRRAREACTYRPDPSVIMTNQIVAGFMVDSYRRLLDGQEPQNVFYDATSDTRI